ncbi:hypothetical protein AVEN_13405-1 [Araneus ventricosus]|uniref:Mariner Mos1 transposase n=1 Tax=Araneus ventricosus TaxID=182803 RepID=A0A4Y2UV22_ARAVE|nr:hypothetical protein AVEN_191786-1 [Araneus ventricosus]GBO16850.1 hypothetical protein AVEN_213707-1 [Araneus ventricosus]GBO16933.1 hypothetical protein AVEN_13405-1 [Araneus ventricosus]
MWLSNEHRWQRTCFTVCEVKLTNEWMLPACPRGSYCEDVSKKVYEEITSCALSQLSTTVFTSLPEENLVPDFNFGKRKLSLGHLEVTRRKRPGMLSDGVILLHDNTHTARKTEELLRKFKWEVWSHPL